MGVFSGSVQGESSGEVFRESVQGESSEKVIRGSVLGECSGGVFRMSVHHQGILVHHQCIISTSSVHH